MTGEILNPDYTEVITYIIGQTSQFVLLSAVIVGMVNQIKNSVPSGLKQFMRVVAIALGIGSLRLMNKAFSVDLSTYKVIFFGMIMGLTSVGLYEGGFLKKNKNPLDSIKDLGA